jgi:hypothetical protein
VGQWVGFPLHLFQQLGHHRRADIAPPSRATWRIALTNYRGTLVLVR